jgi:hypothetical protein
LNQFENGRLEIKNSRFDKPETDFDEFGRLNPVN